MVSFFKHRKKELTIMHCVAEYPTAAENMQLNQIDYLKNRFKDIRVGISSIIALAHDVLVVVAFYAAARVSVGNTFVACLLTIVGYSINATIVIFDRIREKIKSMHVL